MTESFSTNLRNFSLSIDIVNDKIWIDTLVSITKYLDKLLNVYSYGMLKKGKVTGEDGLITIWQRNGAEDKPYELMKNGRYFGQVSYAFDKGKELWIVSSDKKQEFLNSATKFKDLWDTSGKDLPEDFPEFDVTHERKIRTSIIFPLRKRNGKPWGVLNLESEDHLDPSSFEEDIRHELALIAKSITTLFNLKQINKEMMDRSKRSLDKIDDMVQQHQIPKNPLREKENAVFVAYADNVDEEVISIIRKVINNFDQKIKPYFWKDLTHLGNTFDLIWEKINSCCLGICYFAERLGGIKHSDQGKGIDLRKFRYNPNVLVEAGMMQAISVIEKSKKEGTKPFKWLPIRESSMENIHYLYQQKAVIIERDKSGKISNPEDIYSIIKKHIEDYIQEYEI